MCEQARSSTQTDGIAKKRPGAGSWAARQDSGYVPASISRSGVGRRSAAGTSFADCTWQSGSAGGSPSRGAVLSRHTPRYVQSRPPDAGPREAWLPGQRWSLSPIIPKNARFFGNQWWSIPALYGGPAPATRMRRIRMRRMSALFTATPTPELAGKLPNDAQLSHRVGDEAYLVAAHLHHRILTFRCRAIRYSMSSWRRIVKSWL